MNSIDKIYQGIVDELSGLGFTVIEDDFPLEVSLNQLEYPVAILSSDSASGITKQGYVELHFSISLLWPGDPNYNYLASINQAEAIASAMRSITYVVTPIKHKEPDVSGGLIRMSVKSGLNYVCPNPNIER